MCILSVFSCLTARAACRYAARMRGHEAAVIVVLCAGLSPSMTCAGEKQSVAAVISADDYALYDQTIKNTFLTSHTRLVVIERMTVTRLLPDQTEPTTLGFFHDRNYFMGRLPPDLVLDFVGANREAGRLESRFQFGVRYRFVSADSIEDSEAAVAWPVKTGRIVPVQAPSILDRLAFSRVGRTFRNDQALLYVENSRSDGTGAGFLVWFRKQARIWAIHDTEVVWTVRPDDEAREESP